jgi:hypothetical protein
VADVAAGDSTLIVFAPKTFLLRSAEQWFFGTIDF